MVINLLAHSQRPFFLYLLHQMLDYYHIPPSPSAHGAFSDIDNLEKMCKWMKEHRSLTMKTFRFEFGNSLIGHGLEIEDSPYLTKELLKFQETLVDK
jgi:hypothetical protein